MKEKTPTTQQIKKQKKRNRVVLSENIKKGGKKKGNPGWKY